jgi:hypothetical protein
MSAVMELQCYICGHPDYKVSIRADDADDKSKCSGSCHRCNIMVCNGHGERVKVEDRYRCALCIPEYIRDARFVPRKPDDPVQPPVTPEMVTKAIAFSTEPVIAKVGTAMTEYLRRRGLSENDALGKRGLEIAAKAFSDATGITQFLKALERERILEES